MTRLLINYALPSLLGGFLVGLALALAAANSVGVPV